MWTAWNEVIQQPQLWDRLQKREIRCGAWFPMLSKGCTADVVCMPAPIHKPDGSEDLWCYTKPQEFYGELLEDLGHFPLQHFWGPLANIKSSQWIADSALAAAKKFKPDFFYIYVPHLDYAAQKYGPNSPEAMASLEELDQLLNSFVSSINNIYENQVEWMIVSEYVISEVDHVTYPNRLLRESGLLSTVQVDGKELIDFENTPAWALVDHQFSHVFVKDSAPSVINQCKNVLGPHHEHVLDAKAQVDWGIQHERGGDLVVISNESSWQAYYWWLDDDRAPEFARTVDIHRKPGYDPVELCFDFATKSVPLDASLIKGSHGRALPEDKLEGVVISSTRMSNQSELTDIELHDVVLKHFNLS